MKEEKNVQGSQETVPEIEVNHDTVYVRSNIRRESFPVGVDTEETIEMWVYDEIQYPKNEFIETQGKTNVLQNELISSTQDAVDFVLLTMASEPVNAGLNIKSIMGDGKMAGYLATRIMIKGKISELEGQNAYRDFFSLNLYKQFKQEADVILIAEGYDNLIVTV